MKRKQNNIKHDTQEKNMKKRIKKNLLRKKPYKLRICDTHKKVKK